MYHISCFYEQVSVPEKRIRDDPLTRSVPAITAAAPRERSRSKRAQHSFVMSCAVILALTATRRQQISVMTSG